ncbi:MAG: D-glycerate dehydrogenase [Nitrososphaerota archaeon]|nr:D-glycerate dehydrogenase [Nitrososphaerales archaeon]MDW8044544.1 D-glycerate dehydrogenase [Nitrososphaerota archaeon]
MRKIVITAPIREEGIRLLEKEAKLKIFPRPPTEDELMKEMSDVDALLVTTNVERITKRLIDAAQRLKIIARHGVGYENVDVDAATQKGVWVTVTPVLSETVADHVFALILCLSRNICKANDYIKSKKWLVRDPLIFMGSDVSNKTIGIIGLGRIGSCVAERAKGFNMNILYNDIVRKVELEEKLNLRFTTLEGLLSESDYVVVSLPLTQETIGFIGERELKLMKRTAFLINIARGAIVDHNALVRALKEGWIAGAGIDVFYKEPLPTDDPILELDNVILTPHIASNTIECRKRMSITAAEEILRVFHGEEPKYPVNKIH